MKRQRITGLIFALVFIAISFIGCEVDDKVSKEERISMFLDDLNTVGRSGIQDNFVLGLTNDGALVEFNPSYAWSWSGGTSSGTFSYTAGVADDIGGTFSWQDMGTPLTGSEWKIKKLVTDGNVVGYTNEEPPVSE